MCDWRGGERTFVNHVRYCYPRTLTYLVVMVSLIFLMLVLELLRSL